MIEQLRLIVTRVAEAADLGAALECAVQGVREAMGVAACAAYLVDPSDDYLVLMETDGLDRKAIGKVRLAPGEGVVGLVRERREPVALEDASVHPRFRPFPVTGEKRFGAFLGAPMIHRGKVLGVLIVFRRNRRRFGTRQEDFLVTATAQLAGVLAMTLARPDGRIQLPRGPQATYVQGVPGAPGVAIGEVVAASVFAELDAVPDRTAADTEVEVTAFREAVTAVQAELIASGERMQGLLPSEAHSLFEVYALLVGDESLATRVFERIHEGLWAPAALRDAIRELVAVFEAMEDERLRARAEDIRAVGRRLLLELQVDSRAPREFPERTVLVGDEVSLARIADVPRERLAGIICLRGSVLSHTVVIARALGVPAVMGLGDLATERLAGHSVVIDGYIGRVFIDPAPAVVAEFARLEREEEALTAELEALRDLPAETTDGTRILLYANTGLVSDIEPSLRVESAGVGLYRSEFPFMLRESFPSESEQYETYRRMLEAFAPRPVVMRTLDIGGDKPLAYFPIEETNSLLGWRGIRVALQHPEILLAQLKAMLRASAGLDNLSVLLPMVSQPSEVRAARVLLDQVLDALDEEGVSVVRPPLGVMLEVPLALFGLDALAREADFFSIGTNDLTQYLTAVDRGNPRVAHLYNHLAPAVLRAIKHAVDRAHQLDKPVSLCGELAGDPVGAVLLLGMGLDHLSASASSLPRIKWVIRSISRAHAVELLERALSLPDAGAVRSLINSALEDVGLGGLVRAGR